MSENKFKIGDRVGLDFKRYSPDVYLSYGVVTDVTTLGKVQVKWDASWKSESLISQESLLPENELQKKLDKLSAEFEIVEKSVTEKVEEAAKFLTEAAQICDKNDLVLRDMYKSVKSLLDAMDNAGWNTSSFNC